MLQAIVYLASSHRYLTVRYLVTEPHNDDRYSKPRGNPAAAGLETKQVAGHRGVCDRRAHFLRRSQAADPAQQDSLSRAVGLGFATRAEFAMAQRGTDTPSKLASYSRARGCVWSANGGIRAVRQPAPHCSLHWKTTGLFGFQAIHGNIKLLLLFLVLVWILAAFGEEMVWRGYLMNRVADLGRHTRLAWIISLFAVNLVFGTAHAYQGISGILDEGLMGILLGIL